MIRRISSSVDPVSLTATFDLTGAAVDEWDVEIWRVVGGEDINSDCLRGYPNNFKITD